MAELRKYKLGEIAKIYNGSTPSTLDASNYDGDIIWATPKDLSDQNSKYFSKGSRNITQKGFDSCSTQMIPANNILMSSRAPIGLFAINTVDCCTNQGFKNIVLDKAIADVDFMYYFLKYHVKEIEALGSGTTFREVSKTAFEKYEISIPSLPTQQKIASVLSKLDRKISVNREINRNLEELAKQIYDYWFLQFDFPNEDGKPYKSSGGKMVWNEILKRDIPAGWNCFEMQNICNISRGASPRPIEAYMDTTNTGIPWIKISDATEDIESPYLLKIKDCIIPEGKEKSVSVKPDTLIVSNSATPGIPKFVELNACVHDGWLILDKYDSYYKYYLFYVIKMVRYNLLYLASGSIFKNLKTDYLKTLPTLVPDIKILQRFDEKIERIMKHILKTEREINELIELRDNLLPLIMNGQVTLNSCLSAD